MTVEDSVVFGNADHAVWNWVFTNEAPAAGRVHVSTSVLDTDEAEGGTGNVVGTPELDGQLQLTAGSVGVGIAAGGGNPGLATGRPR